MKIKYSSSEKMTTIGNDLIGRTQKCDRLMRFFLPIVHHTTTRKRVNEDDFDCRTFRTGLPSLTYALFLVAFIE